MLNGVEVKFVKETAGFYTDSRIVEEINRIRKDVGNDDAVTIDMVRKARYKLGIKKVGRSGRVRRDRED
tara:strand:- start:116 stop:322 length:207 start_codon:yes stop_codon:yes gene_type:complete